MINSKMKLEKSKINKAIITNKILKHKKTLNLIQEANNNVINLRILTPIVIKNLMKIKMMEKKVVIVKVKYVLCVKNHKKSHLKIKVL